MSAGYIVLVSYQHFVKMFCSMFIVITATVFNDNMGSDSSYWPSSLGTFYTLSKGKEKIREEEKFRKAESQI